MSNWTAITEAGVKSAKNSLILATVRSMATASGDADPLPKIIADVVARIRRAIATGNALDSNAAKIPISLEGLALRMITRRLKDYAEIPLTNDELKQADEDKSDLLRISDERLACETADDPASGAEQQINATPAPRITPRQRRFTHSTEDGL